MHYRPVRVHAQRPGKGLQAKQSESLRAQDLAIQKPDQNRNSMSHSLQSPLCTKPYIQLLKWTFDNYEVNISKVLAMIYHCALILVPTYEKFRRDFRGLVAAAMASVYVVCVFKFQAFMLRSDQRLYHVYS